MRICLPNEIHWSFKDGKVNYSETVPVPEEEDIDKAIEGTFAYCESVLHVGRDKITVSKEGRNVTFGYSYPVANRPLAALPLASELLGCILYEDPDLVVQMVNYITATYQLLNLDPDGLDAVRDVMQRAPKDILRFRSYRLAFEAAAKDVELAGRILLDCGHTEAKKIELVELFSALHTLAEHPEIPQPVAVLLHKGWPVKVLKLVAVIAGGGEGVLPKHRQAAFVVLDYMLGRADEAADEETDAAYELASDVLEAYEEDPGSLYKPERGEAAMQKAREEWRGSNTLSGQLMSPEEAMALFVGIPQPKTQPSGPPIARIEYEGRPYVFDGVRWFFEQMDGASAQYHQVEEYLARKLDKVPRDLNKQP